MLSTLFPMLYITSSRIILQLEICHYHFKRRKLRQRAQERNPMAAGVRDHRKTLFDRGTCFSPFREEDP